jgi:hypothetical protein
MNLDARTLMTLGSKLLHILKDASQHVSQLNQAGEEVSREALQFYIMLRFENWNPKIKGVSVLDDQSRVDGAAFLAGIAFTLAAGMKGRSAA